jgi:hypothetical protein
MEPIHEAEAISYCLEHWQLKVQSFAAQNFFLPVTSLIFTVHDIPMMLKFMSTESNSAIVWFNLSRMDMQS